MNREVTLLDFKIDDLDNMNISFEEVGDIKTLKDNLFNVLKTGDARLIQYNDKTIAAMGYYSTYSGACELWVIPNLPIVNKGVLGITLKHALDEFVLSQNFHRIQATVLKDDPSEEFLTKLGFESEGILKQYDALKRDYRMWARIQL
jgi:hypothetical protein